MHYEIRLWGVRQSSINNGDPVPEECHEVELDAPLMPVNKHKPHLLPSPYTLKPNMSKVNRSTTSTQPVTVSTRQNLTFADWLQVLANI